MGFLLAKITILMLLAALLGAWFANWWVRRRYEDVTTDYSRLKSDWQTWRKAFEEKLAARPDVDLKPLTARLDDLPAAVRGILFPLHDRLGALAGAIDMAPVQERLAALERAVRAIVVPAPREVELQPVYDRLAELGAAIESARVDLSPVMLKLEALAKTPSAPPQAAPPTPTAPTAAVIRAGSRNLLAHAAFGAPDDLKLIKGVARVMERMLHDIGVYYFWQIAEWTPADVAHADAQLTAFRGRIERDHWVIQSRQLAGRPQSARKPDAG